jgi:phosphoglycerol geranylgeranyltransferase
MVFLDAGSGAPDPVPVEMLAHCCAESPLPIAVGGGVRTPEHVQKAFRAGAPIVVVGTATEAPDFEERIRVMAAASDMRLT